MSLLCIFPRTLIISVTVSHGPYVETLLLHGQGNILKSSLTIINISSVCNYRDKSQNENLQILASHNSPLCNIDLNVSFVPMLLIWLCH